jgi:hypothetical protein
MAIYKPSFIMDEYNLKSAFLDKVYWRSIIMNFNSVKLLWDIWKFPFMVFNKGGFKVDQDGSIGRTASRNVLPVSNFKKICPAVEEQRNR